MRWTTSQAIELLKRGWPGHEVIVEDGGADYWVGTIEDSQGEIVASFMLLTDGGHENVDEILISGGQKYCGVATRQFSVGQVQHAVPIHVTRRNRDGSLWGMVGDYEVCVPSDSLIEHSHA